MFLCAAGHWLSFKEALAHSFASTSLMAKWLRQKVPVVILMIAIEFISFSLSLPPSLSPPPLTLFLSYSWVSVRADSFKIVCIKLRS